MSRALTSDPQESGTAFPRMRPGGYKALLCPCADVDSVCMERPSELPPRGYLWPEDCSPIET